MLVNYEKKKLFQLQTKIYFIHKTVVNFINDLAFIKILIFDCILISI